jgi:uncharacterized protein
VKQQKDFVIPFKGLSTGLHQYTFKIDKAFFESFEYFETETGNINVELELMKEPALLDLHFKLDGIINLVCDRCLGNFSNTINGEFRLIVKFGDAYSEESEEVVVLPNTESSIDIKQFIFEYINLLLPIKRVHVNKIDCDPTMLQKLQNHIEQSNDPRWDALKNIKLK